MKTNLDTTKHEIVGSKETRNLTIEANGKAFKELISGIYSDKAYAIARETMANCVDSHVQAGTPERAFDIRIPTTFEPEYLIRDYGVSMTHETVMTLYSTLFRSTKDDPNSDESNKFVGKFGLGSKSPFSYTDAFQLTAFLDGECRVYDIYFNGGIPQIALFASTETDEPNGIQITFPVDPKDCPDFERAIVRACEGLPVLPNFIGKTPRIPTRSVVRQGSRWKLLDSTATGSAEAKQGTVLYPLNKHAVIDCPVSLFPLFDLTIHLDFPIGELDVTTSREALSYDASTSANIVRAFEELRQELRDEVVTQLRAATTYHEFNVLFHMMQQKFAGPLWNLLDMDREHFNDNPPIKEYRVRTTDKVTVIHPETYQDGTLIPAVVKSEHRFGDLQFCDISTAMTKSYATIGRFREDYRRNVPVSAVVEEIVLLLEDETIRPRYTYQRLDILKRSRQFLDKPVQVFWVKHSKDPSFAIKRLRAACGRAPIRVIHLKEIDYASQRISGNDSAYVPDDFKILKRGQWMSPDGMSPPEEAYYVCLYKGDVEGYNLYPSALQDIVRHMVAIGEEDLPIVGIPKSRRSQIRKNPGWRELIPLAQQVLPECIDKEMLTALYIKERFEEQDIHDKMVKLRKLLGPSIFDPLVAGTSFTDMIEAHEVAKAWMSKAASEPAALVNLLNKLKVTELDVVEDCDKAADSIVQAYDRACQQVDRGFALLKHLKFPKVPDAQIGTVVDFNKARERRLTILPFYVWLKSCRPVQTRNTHTQEAA